MKQGVLLRFIVLLILAFVLFSLDVLKGSVSIPMNQVLSIVSQPFELLRTEGELSAELAGYRDIVLLFRLPRAATAIVAGMGLALSGLFM